MHYISITRSIYCVDVSFPLITRQLPILFRTKLFQDIEQLIIHVIPCKMNKKYNSLCEFFSKESKSLEVLQDTKHSLFLSFRPYSIST